MRTITKNLARLKLFGKKILGYKRRWNYANARIHHEKKIIFIHIPKTAGNSITSALRKINSEPRKKSPKIAKHAKAFEVKYLLGNEIWEKYFTFSFVRNPWDLMVSSYNWWQQKAPTLSGHRKNAKKISKMDFHQFIKSKYGSHMINERYGNYFDWLGENGKIIVDFIGKFESINKNWEKICEFNRFEKIKIPHINKTNRKKYQMYYNSESKNIIANRFKKSIDKFGYKF